MEENQDVYKKNLAALPAPAPVDNHGLLPDTDGWVDDGIIEFVEKRGTVLEDAANFNLTSDFDFSLDRLLSEIEEIPEDKLKRNEDSGEAEVHDLSIFERGELIARASWWKIAQRVAAIVQLLGTTAIPAAKLLRIKKYIKALGGTKQAVKLLLGAASKAEKLKAGGQALVALAAELLGISTVKNNCF
ncbi:hypothetical protein N0V88_003360 [Collariella sp. IMI 366227]|nr:hypothetical protein N0V88_003360 [Collariella sp. IMI 366227]